MHLINLIVNYSYRKYGVPLHFFFRKLDQRYKSPFKTETQNMYNSARTYYFVRSLIN